MTELRKSQPTDSPARQDEPDRPLSGEADSPDLNALLAFFTVEGVGTAVRESGFSATEAIQILVDVARNAGKARDRMAAVKLLEEKFERTLRLNRILQSDTERTLSWDSDEGGVRALHVRETTSSRLGQSAAATEKALRRELDRTNGSVESLPAPSTDTDAFTDATDASDVVDVEPEPDPQPRTDR
jgi:hypothetical protein